MLHLFSAMESRRRNTKFNCVLLLMKQVSLRQQSIDSSLVRNYIVTIVCPPTVVAAVDTNVADSRVRFLDTIPAGTRFQHHYIQAQTLG